MLLWYFPTSFVVVLAMVFQWWCLLRWILTGTLSTHAVIDVSTVRLTLPLAFRCLTSFRVMALSCLAALPPNVKLDGVATDVPFAASGVSSVIGQTRHRRER